MSKVLLACSRESNRVGVRTGWSGGGGAGGSSRDADEWTVDVRIGGADEGRERAVCGGREAAADRGDDQESRHDVEVRAGVHDRCIRELEVRWRREGGR